MEQDNEPNGTETEQVPIGSAAIDETLTASKWRVGRMMLREWSINHAYASYYVEPIGDLDVAAEALVKSAVVSSAYVADGHAYWMTDGKLESERPDLKWREHENHAELKLPDSINGWARKGLFEALLHRFSEKKLMSPLPGPQHEYLRAAMEPSSLLFEGEDEDEDEEVIVCPTLKLYKTGVFTISFDVIGEGAVDVPRFVTRYVNLFTRWCNEVWVPHAVAMLGAATPLYRDANGRVERAANWNDFVMMQKAARDASQTVEVEDLKFEMFPAHEPLDDFFMKMLLEAAKDPKLQRKLPPKVRELVAQLSSAQSEPVSQGTAAGSSAAVKNTPAVEKTEGAPVGTLPSTSEEPSSAPASDVVDDVSAGTGKVPAPATEVATTSASTPDSIEAVDEEADPSPIDSEDEPETQSYQLSDMFDNAEFAIRVALDPPPDLSRYVKRGLAPTLTHGNYWSNRPQISINAFDDQPATASEIRERFGDELGLIMMRVSEAPPSVARAHLGESLRPFEDWTLHISEALSLCVYARDSRALVHPRILETTDRACLCELIDYVAMRCHQLDERASLARSVADARAVRADLGSVENLARNAFRMGELNAAAKAAWQQLELSTRVKEVREKIALAAEAASERSHEQGARFSAALAVVFGIVGAAGLTDSFTKPLWTSMGLPLPAGFEGPICFAISAGLVGIVLWLVSRALKPRS